MRKLFLILITTLFMLTGCKHYCYDFIEYDFIEEDGVQYVVEVCKKCDNTVAKTRYDKVEYDLAFAAIMNEKSAFSNETIYKELYGEEWTHDCGEYTKFRDSLHVYKNTSNSIDSYMCSKCEKMYYVIDNVINLDKDYISECLKLAHNLNTITDEELAQHDCLDVHWLSLNAKLCGAGGIQSSGMCGLCGAALEFKDGYYNEEIPIGYDESGEHDCSYFAVTESVYYNDIGNKINIGKCLKCDSSLEFINGKLVTVK